MRRTRTPLTDAEIALGLTELPGWSRRGDALAFERTFPDVPAAAAFIVRVLFAAEAADHHPEIVTVHTRVALTLSTHDAGNRVTATDLALAHKIAKFKV